jgi:hypothetical protein
VYVQNGDYTLQPFNRKKVVKCCKHGTTEHGEGAALIFTDNTQNDRGVYCLACVMELLDREAGRLN